MDKIYIIFNMSNNKVSKDILVKLFVPTKRNNFTEKDRIEILSKQNVLCNLCLKPFGGNLTYEIDHIIPLEQGGSNVRANLQALCPTCHIYKTSVLDKGVIARLLQASRTSKITPTRNEILEQCQILYRNRNRDNAPHYDDEMIDFAIDAREILHEMCKRKISRVNTMTSELSLSDIIKEPSKSTPKNTNPLNHLIDIIDNMEKLHISSSNLTLKKFDLEIHMDEFNKKILKTEKFKKKINNFFRKCSSGKIKKNFEENICNIKIIYKPKN
jgi:hypothetical protein